MTKQLQIISLINSHFERDDLRFNPIAFYDAAKLGLFHNDCKIQKEFIEKEIDRIHIQNGIIYFQQKKIDNK